MTEKGPPVTDVRIEASIKSKSYDCVIAVGSPTLAPPGEFRKFAEKALERDPVLKTEVGVIALKDYPYESMIYSPTGEFDPDYHDIRVMRDAGHRGMQRVLKMGLRKPLLLLGEDGTFESAELVTLLGVLQALYVPIQLREFDAKKKNPIDYLGVYHEDQEKLKKIVADALKLESGRRVACDIGDGDPERMAPPRVEEYIYNVFANSNIKLETIKDPKVLAKEYPLFAAVNRAAADIERHQGRIVFLEYAPADPSKIKETLLFVGKGVTYDTGGMDVKINGAMVGMSRDKCGAAAVVGFMQIVNLVRPEDVRVVVAVPLVRNSIGSNGYVADEVIVSRSGSRVRVVNTDAEGRMIMADVLCKMKEIALEAINPHLFTIATLTGHAFLTVGEGYSIAMDNGPAKRTGNAGKLQRAGDTVGDIFEISRIRPEDFQMHKGEAVGDDVKQGNNQPSTRTPRGHQGPAAFLILASGLDKHGSMPEKSNTSLKYTHIDIAASAGEYPKPATGAPVQALAQAYLL